MSNIVLPVVIEYNLNVKIDTKGQIHFKCDRQIEAVELVNHLQTVQTTILTHFLTARAKMLQDQKIVG